MSTVLTFFPKLESTIPYDVQRHLQLIYLKLNNHAQAAQALSTQIANLKTATNTIIKESSGSSGGSTTIIQYNTLPGLGTVNDQVGVTSYTTQKSDNGALIAFGDASPIAVTLDSTVITPWMAFIVNNGTSVATLTPSTGTITYPGNAGAASLPLPTDFWCLVVFDGVNFWAAIQPLSATGVVYPYKAVTSTYNIALTDFQIECTTGTFTVTLPTAVGITGQAFSIKNTGAGTITVATTAAQTIDGSTTATLFLYNNLMVMSNGANWIAF